MNNQKQPSGEAMAQEQGLHQELIARMTEGGAAPQVDAIDPIILRSWGRSVDAHRLKPTRSRKPQMLSPHAIRRKREALEPLLYHSRDLILRAYEQLSPADYVLLLTDAEGVTVEFLSRCGPLLDGALAAGACWAEQDEGTNAIGTCIVERQPVTVHRREHFLETNRVISCTASPIFSYRGELLAVLNATTLNASGARQDQFLAQQFVAGTAYLIETVAFFEAFRKSWILKLSRPAGLLETRTELLLAMNGDGRVVGANRSAFTELSGVEGLLGKTTEELLDVDFESLLQKTPAEIGHGLCLHAGPSRRTYFGLLRWPCDHSFKSAPAAKVQAPSHECSDESPSIEALAGNDPAMQLVAERARRVVNRPISILLHGETGVGKELFARALHEASQRASGAFVALNCAAIPEALIESELFGYGEGAFTGARKKGMKGKILQASGGTLFLDEIGDMPLDLQSRLLRVIAQNEVHPLGQEHAIKVDLHLVSATHRDLRTLVASGRFREDLYFRLAGMTFELPALRDRADRGELIQRIIDSETPRGASRKVINTEAREVLLRYSWPGNIRQLQNVARYCLAVTQDETTIGVGDLPPEVNEPWTGVRNGSAEAMEAPDFDERKRSQRDALINALKLNRWDISKTARMLGVSRMTLYRRIDRFRIQTPKDSLL